MAGTIFWAGDSTVKQNNITSFPQTGIGQGFELYLKKGIILDNRAENGRSTKSYINEGRLDEIEALIGKGDFLFIQFGHNDEKPDEERHTEPYSTYQENLVKFVNAARDNGAYPVFITSLYRRLFESEHKLIDNCHLDYPDAMLQLGETLNVPVIDLCTLSKNVLEKIGDENSKHLFMHVPAGVYANFPEGKTDNSHLQYEGAVLFAGLIAEGLRKLGGIYADLLLPLDGEREDARLLID